MNEEERRRIETILDHHLYPEREKQWETKCRVCGRPLTFHGCNKQYCNKLPYPKHRADDHLPHTTSDAQMREDRTRLTPNQHREFTLELLRWIKQNFENPDEASLIGLALRIPPYQQAIAMARAFGEKVEG